MHPKSVYKTKEFEFDFSKKEIRMYRKKYNYLSIPFSEVRHVEIKKGSVVRNVVLLALIAGLLFFFTIVWSGNLINKLNEAGNYAPLNHSDIRRIGANFILSVSTLFFASYILYSIFKKEMVLKINKKSKPYPLKELAKTGLLEQFIEDLNKVFGDESFDLSKK